MKHKSTHVTNWIKLSEDANSIERTIQYARMTDSESDEVISEPCHYSIQEYRGNIGGQPAFGPSVYQIDLWNPTANRIHKNGITLEQMAAVMMHHISETYTESTSPFPELMYCALERFVDACRQQGKIEKKYNEIPRRI